MRNFASLSSCSNLPTFQGAPQLAPVEKVSLRDTFDLTFSIPSVPRNAYALRMPFTQQQAHAMIGVKDAAQSFGYHSNTLLMRETQARLAYWRSRPTEFGAPQQLRSLIRQVAVIKTRCVSLEKKVAAEHDLEVDRNLGLAQRNRMMQEREGWLNPQVAPPLEGKHSAARGGKSVRFMLKCC